MNAAPVDQPVDQNAQPDVNATSDTDGNMALAGLAVLIALIGMGGVGFMMMRRRRTAADETLYAEEIIREEPVYETAVTEETIIAEPEAEPMEPAAPAHVASGSLADEPIYREREPMAESARQAAVDKRRPSVAVSYGSSAPPMPKAEPGRALAAQEPPRERVRSPIATRNEDGTSPFVHNPFYKGKAPEDRPVFVMPEGPVPTGARRTELLHEMIAARPDADNPYTSPKRRLRRARALLNQRERMLRDQATRPFDFRDYNPVEANRPARTTPVPHMA